MTITGRERSRSIILGAIAILGIVLLLTAFGCRRSPTPTPQATATPSPTAAVPTSTATPARSPTPSPTPQPTTVRTPTPTPTPVQINPGGTLPPPPVFPTATLGPSPSETPMPKTPEQAREDVRNYLLTTQSIVADALEWYEKLQSAGVPSKPASEASALIKETALRLAALYKAATIVSSPLEASTEHTEVLKAFSQRQKWFNDALANLDKGIVPDSVPPPQDILSARNGLMNLAAKFGLQYPVETPATRTFTSLTQQLSMSFPWDWIVAEANSKIVLIAPIALQGPGQAGLGLSAEKYGSAFKVWGSKNPGNWDLSKADQEAQLFVSSLGTTLSKESVTVDGAPGYLRIVENANLNWKSLFVVVVKGNYTYMVEAGCPSDIFDKCRPAFQNILDGVKLTG